MGLERLRCLLAIVALFPSAGFVFAFSFLNAIVLATVEYPYKVLTDRYELPKVVSIPIVFVVFGIAANVLGMFGMLVLRGFVWLCG